MTATLTPADCAMESPMRREIESALSVGFALGELKTGRVRLTSSGRCFFAQHLLTMKIDPAQMISIEDLRDLIGHADGYSVTTQPYAGREAWTGTGFFSEPAT